MEGSVDNQAICVHRECKDWEQKLRSLNLRLTRFLQMPYDEQRESLNIESNDLIFVWRSQKRAFSDLMMLKNYGVEVEILSKLWCSLEDNQKTFANLIQLELRDENLLRAWCLLPAVERAPENLSILQERGLLTGDYLRQAQDNVYVERLSICLRAARAWNVWRNQQENESVQCNCCLLI